MRGRKPYPLFLSTRTALALDFYCDKKGLTKGKALNELITNALVDAGFLRPCNHLFVPKNVRSEGRVLRCQSCGVAPSALEVPA